MDFLKSYDARAAAENLIEYELRDQASGEIIKSGKKPCIVLIRSTMSEEILAADRAEKNAAMKEAFRRARTKGDKSEDADVDFDWSKIEAAVNDRAVKLIAGFKNMQTADGDAVRDLTEADAAAFVALNRISEEHHWRRVIPIGQNDDESDEEFDARKERIKAEWLRPSFAQQVVDAASEHADFLGKPAKP
jgi:hypothetical protein